MLVVVLSKMTPLVMSCILIKSELGPPIEHSIKKEN